MTYTTHNATLETTTSSLQKLILPPPVKVADNQCIMFCVHFPMCAFVVF